tara:strand:- start:32 stop:340 length:309 start_codon:yes stop_codon:yes gene_type:complete
MSINGMMEGLKQSHTQEQMEFSVRIWSLFVQVWKHYKGNTMADKHMKKYKATESFDVDAFNDFEGLGNSNHSKLCRGEIVELDFEPTALIKNKMLKEVKGDK